MIQSLNLDSRRNWKCSDKEFFADIIRAHELLDVSRIMGEGNDVVHLSSHACQHISDILKDLADLSTHLLGTNKVAVLVEGDLTLQVNHLTIALDDGHGEGPERSPYASRVDGIYYRRSP